ncbi:hypothetical protein GN956_G15988 [Arapaima gigas]
MCLKQMKTILKCVRAPRFTAAGLLHRFDCFQMEPLVRMQPPEPRPTPLMLWASGIHETWLPLARTAAPSGGKCLQRQLFNSQRVADRTLPQRRSEPLASTPAAIKLTDVSKEAVCGATAVRLRTFSGVTSATDV